MRSVYVLREALGMVHVVITTGMDTQLSVLCGSIRRMILSSLVVEVRHLQLHVVVGSQSLKAILDSCA